MKICLFRGTELVSEGIEDFTRSPYSHAATWFPELGGFYEAVQGGFVECGGPGVNHPKGTIVDVLSYKIPLAPAEEEIALMATRSMVGAGYDYAMVFAGFPLRLEFKPKADRDKFFCSEAVFLTCAAMGPSRLLLERLQAWEASPRDISISPLLLWESSLVL